VPTSPADLPEARDQAAYSIGFLAIDFITEPETWPVFAAWCRSKSSVPLIASGPDVVRPLGMVLFEKMNRG
jgi:hypothetical protein